MKTTAKIKITPEWVGGGTSSPVSSGVSTKITICQKGMRDDTKYCTKVYFYRYVCTTY